MSHWLIQNAGLAVPLACIAWVASRILRDRPGLAHVLWLLVLVRLMLPDVPLPRGMTIDVWQYDAPRGEFEREEVPTRPRMAANLGPMPRTDAPGRCLEWYGKSPQEARPSGGEGDSSSKVTEADDEPRERRIERREHEVRTNTATWVEAFPFVEKQRISNDDVLPSRESSESATSGKLLDLVFAAWLLGALVYVLIHVRRTWILHRWIRRGVPAPEALERRMRAIAEFLKVRPPRMVLLRGIGSPFVWCLLRPVLVWPADSRTGLAVAADRTVLAHELAHLARRDHWTAWFEIVVGVFFYWNPVFWWGRRHLRRHAELATDACVVRSFPNERRSYAEALIDSARRKTRGPRIPALSATGAECREFEERLTRIMRSRVPRGLSPVLILLPVAMTLSLLPRWSDARGLGRGAEVELQEEVLQSLARAERFRREGLFHFERRDWARSVRAHARVVREQPEDAEVQARLGIGLLRTGREREALEAFDRQVALGVRLAPAHYNRACALARLDHVDRAFEALDRARAHGFQDLLLLDGDQDLASLRAESERFESYRGSVLQLERARSGFEAAFAAKRWSEVIDRARTLGELAPLDGSVKHFEGYARIVTGDRVGAEQCFLEQLELSFLPHFATYNLACATAQQGRVEESNEWLHRALLEGFQNLELLRTDPDLEALRGSASYASAVAILEEQQAIKARLQEAARVGRFAELEVGCRRVLELVAPGTTAYGWAQHQLGIALLRQGRHAEAALSFERQVRDGYEIDEGLYNVGCALAANGNVERALSYLHLAVEAGFEDRELMKIDADLERVRSHPGFERVLQRLMDRDILGRFEAASWDHLGEVAEERLRENPDDGRHWHTLGWALLRQGHHERAARAFERQAEIGYHRATALYNVACCHALCGREDEAFPWLERAAEAGKISPELVREDVDLASLRDDPRFHEIVRRFEEKNEDRNGPS